MGLFGPYWAYICRFFSSRKYFLSGENISFRIVFIYFCGPIGPQFVGIVPVWANIPFYFGLKVDVISMGATPPNPAQYGPTALSMRALRALLGLRPALICPYGQIFAECGAKLGNDRHIWAPTGPRPCGPKWITCPTGKGLGPLGPGPSAHRAWGPGLCYILVATTACSYKSQLVAASN